MVGHLEQPGPQRGRGGEQVCLRLALGIAGEQHPPGTLVDAQDQRHLVDLVVAAGEGPTRGRGQDVHGQVPQRRALARRRLGDRHAGGGRGLPERRLDAVVGVDVAQPHRPDTHPLEHPREPRAVVRVGVAEHDEVEPSHPVAAQPRGDRGLVRATVDQDPCPTALDQDGVALPDVDGGHGQRARDRARDRDQQRPTHHHHGRGHPCRAAPTSSQQPGTGPHRHQQDGRPVQRHHWEVGHLRSPEHDPQRQVGQGEDDTGGPGVHDGHHRGHGDDHRGECCGGHGEQVGGDRGQWDLADPDQQHRRHGNLGADGDGRQAGEGPRPPMQSSCDPRGDDQHAGGRGGREQQAQ